MTGKGDPKKNLFKDSVMGQHPTMILEKAGGRV